MSALSGIDHARNRGKRLAELYAGPWPVSGTLAEYEAAIQRALHWVRLTQDIEYRWNVRLCWDRLTDDEREAEIDHSKFMRERLAARRQHAIYLYEDRLAALDVLQSIHLGSA